MNRKQLILVLVLGIVFGGLGLYMNKNRKQSFQTGDPTTANRVVANFPLNEVAQLRIKAANGEVNLARENDVWVVRERENYPANFVEVSEFLRKVWELKPIERVTVGASQFARLQLNAPDNATGGGTLVEFKDSSGKTLNSLLLGKQHTREMAGGPFGGGGETPVGRYVMIPGAQATVYLVSETFSNAEAKPENWINKDFFKVEKVRSVAVSNTTNSWSVARETETGEFKLADAKEGETIDPAKASSVGFVLSSPSFNDVVGKNVAEDKTGFKDGTSATIETFDGFTYTVKIGKPTSEDNHHFTMDVSAKIQTERNAAADEKPEDKERLDKEFKANVEKLQTKLKNEKAYANWTYLVGKWTVDTLLKPRQDLLKVDPKPGDETKQATPAEGAAAPKLDANPPPFPLPNNN